MNSIARDNILWLKQLPYYFVSPSELQSDFGIPTIAKTSFVNNDFLEDIRNLYCSDLLHNLNFDYFTPDSFNDTINKFGCNINFSLFHMNVRSLNKNSEELCQFLGSLSHNFDVLVLSEVWACNITLYSNLLPGYSFYYDLPLASDVGGVGLYVKSSLSHCINDMYKIPSSSDCPVENLWVEVTKGSNRYIIGGLYRHPGYKINNFIGKLDSSLAQISTRNLSCFIAGDVNIDLKRFCCHKDTKAYLDSLIVNNFSPVVVMPTRITDRSATIIDHIYYSDCTKPGASKIISGGNLWCDITDHLPNFVFLRGGGTDKYDSINPPFVRLHTPKNVEKFVQSVGGIDWTDLYCYNNPDEAYNFFNKKITQAYDNSFKLVRLSRKCAKDKNWVTKAIKKSSNHKNKLYKKWLCSHNPADEQKYKNYLKVFKTVTRAAQTAFYKEKFDMRINTTKQLWANLNQISSLCKIKIGTSISKLKYNNQDLTETPDICSALNDYFCSVGPTLVQSLKPSGQDEFEKYCPDRCKNSMFCCPITPDEIVRIIQNLPANKAPGKDGVNSKILKEVSDIIADPLAHIFNLSFVTGIVPDLLKIAKVIPVYKKGERSLPGNYRPISLLSIFDKILEKLMYKRLSGFLEANKILYKYQFGFRKNHSTSQAVMEVLDNIYTHSDNREITMGIYLDLQKAFDTVNHSILLKKLDIYGVRGITLNWFISYLSNRKQYTVLLNHESSLEFINYGVPQGSVLGPLLFLIYMNDIQYAVPDAKLKLFADDTNLFLHNSDSVKLFSIANACMVQLSEWFNANRLSLNLNKTCYSLFGPTHKVRTGLELYISGEVIQNTECCKYLGIFIDCGLKWQEHINYIYNKIIKFTSIFYKVRAKLPQEILRMVYFAFVYPHLVYGIEIYANTTMNHLIKLITLNNKLLRILQQKSFRTHTAELYNTYCTLPI